MKTPEENRYQKIMLLLLLFISINKYTSAQTTCNEPIRIRTNITLCQGDTYQFGDRIITSSGIYIQTYQTVNNCDSIATLGVDYLNSTNFSFTETITTNESYFFKEQNLTEAGIYRDTFVDSRGCDSILTLTLQVIAEQENCANGIDDDGDGLIDAFDADCLCLCELQFFEMEVYDRWGSLVFSTSNVRETWDGRHDGQLLDTGVYLWTVRYQFLEQDFMVEQVETVTIVR